MLLGIILLAAGLWLRWWLQPERQIPRAQARLLSAIEKRDFTAMSALLAADYADRWQHDRTKALARSSEVLTQFATLSITHEPVGLRQESGRWLLVERIRVKGFGGPLAMVARDEVNRLREPFTMEWRQRGGKPWEWELKSMDQPELDIP